MGVRVLEVVQDVVNSVIDSLDNINVGVMRFNTDEGGPVIKQIEDVLLGREELDADAGGRVCVLVESHEISRARGGPHCLTHPLLRD